MPDASTLQIALAALRAIADPIRYLQDRAAAEGGKLNAVAAIQLAKDGGWLQGMASAALQEIQDLEAAEQAKLPTDRPNPYQAPATGCVYKGSATDMARAHRDLLREMVQTQVDITHVLKSVSQLANVTIGFKNDLVKCVIITTQGEEAVTARLMLYQEPEVVGLVPHTDDAQRVSMALSCQNCRVSASACPKQSIRRQSLASGMFRSCPAFDVSDELVMDLVRIIRTLPSIEVVYGQPS